VNKKIFFTGTSMLPNIKPGCKLTVQSGRADNIEIGDIVIFNKDKLICHRVVGKYRIGRKLYFLEKGDNSGSGAVSSISANKIEGRVVGVETFEGSPLAMPDIFSAKDKRILVFLSAIFGACYYLKHLVFGDRYNAFTRKIGLWFSRFF
jgi:signal peptidase I